MTQDSHASDGADDTLDAIVSELARTPEREPPLPLKGTKQLSFKRRLGEGGFGVVFEAEDRTSGRRQAVKLLKSSSGGAAANIERLKREFRSVADVVHPNLVGLDELVCEEGRWFITMDLVEGVDFLSHVEASEGSWRRLRSALRQLVSGVHAIHAAGKLHGDLKPSNVLVDAHGRVVILDFGLASDITKSELMTTDDPTGGTPAYMAPEQLAGAGASEASDWYAVGTMLYEALVGELPFTGTVHEIAQGKLERGAQRPSHLASGASEDLDSLCVQLLKRDPAERPSATAILEQLGAAPSSDRVDVQRSTTVGRVPELAILTEALRTVGSGNPTTIFIHGEPGVGKTALCEAFLASCRQRDEAVVLPARCYERESVPFKALDGVVDAVVHVLRKLGRTEAAGVLPRDIHLLARLFPIVSKVPAIQVVPTRTADAPEGQELRRRAFLALKELLGRLADKQPIVVFIDDLQWGDVDSARLLAELLGPPDPPRLLFIGTYRSKERERSPTLRALLDGPDGGAAHRQIALLPLQDDDAVRLAAQLSTGSLDAKQLARVIREANGHPLFITEMMRDLNERGDVPNKLTTSLATVIGERLRRLHDDARRLLELIAIAGQPLAQGLCFEAAGLGATAPTAMKMLRSHHLVRTSGPRASDAVEPYHASVRDVVLDNTDSDRARACHRSLALTMLRKGNADEETLAEHFDAAGDSQRAGHHAVIAADAAANALAFDRAARLYRMALDRPGVEARRAELLEKLGNALGNAGRGGDAGRVLMEAAAATDGDTRDVRRRAAELLLTSGHRDEGMAVLLPLFDEVGLTLPATTGQAKRRLAWSMTKLMLGGTRFEERHETEVDAEHLLRLDVLNSAGRGLEYVNVLTALALFTEHANLSLKIGEPRRAGQGLAGLIAAFSMRGGYGARSAGVLEQANNLARRVADPELTSDIAHHTGCSALFADGRMRDAVEAFDRADAVLRAHVGEHTAIVRYCQQKAAMALLKLGHLNELKQRCVPQLREAQARGDRTIQMALRILAVAPVMQADDDAEGAVRVLDAIELPGEMSLLVLCHEKAYSDAFL
jgi:hypothetical protein